MALHTRNDTDSEGRITLPDNANITGVVLRTTLFNDTNVKVRPTNTTAWIATVGGSAGAPSVGEIESGRYILLHSGPKGGFTQGGVIAATGSNFLVSDNVHAIITQP